MSDLKPGEMGTAAEEAPSDGRRQRAREKRERELEAKVVAAALPPLTKLVSQIPPPPRLPRVDGIKLVAATVSDARPEPSASQPVTAPIRARKRLGFRDRNGEAMQAWGAALAALCAGAVVVLSSQAPNRPKLEPMGRGLELSANVQAQEASPSGDDSNASVKDNEARAQALALVRQGDELRDQKQWADAEARYTLALETVDGDPSALFGLCRLHLAQKDGVGALASSKRLLLAQPGSAEAHVLLGDAEALLGHKRQAQLAWYRARSLGSLTAGARLEAHE